MAVLVLSFALIGLRWGWMVARITETDVISTYAQRYVQIAGPGAELTDCVGVPGDGDPGIWIVVRCAPPQGAGYDFYVNRWGGLEDGAIPLQSRLDRPAT